MYEIAALSNGKAATRGKGPKVHPVDTTGAGDIFGSSAIYMPPRSDTVPEDLNTIQSEDIGLVASTAASPSAEKLGGIPRSDRRKKAC